METFKKKHSKAISVHEKPNMKELPIKTNLSPEDKTEDKIKQKIKEYPIIQKNTNAQNFINKNVLSLKDLLKLIGYLDLLEDLKKKVYDAKNTENIIKQNEVFHQTIEEYEKKIKKLNDENVELKEKNERLIEKLADSRGRETKLNNELRKEKSKSPMPIRKNNENR